VDESLIRGHRAFAEALLEGTLPPGQFDHAGHLRAAWYFIARFGAREGAQQCARAIQSYAEGLGAVGKYHETLTIALLRIVADAMAQGDWPDWEEFQRENPAIFADVRPLLFRHYSPELLASESAREQFLEPDREPLPDWPVTGTSQGS